MAFDLAQSVRTLGRWYGTKADILAIQAAGTGELSRMYITTDQTVTEYYYFTTPSKIEKWLGTADVIQLIHDNQYIKTVGNPDGAVTIGVDLNGNLTAGINLSPNAGQILSKDVDGKLYATASPSFATGVNNTPTIDLSIVSGKIQGVVKKSAQASNALQLLSDGAYVQDTTVHANSQNYMRKNSDGTLEVLVRPRIQKVDARTYTTMASFLTDLNAGTFVPTSPIAIGDIVFLGGTLGNYEYMGNGTLPAVAADLVTIEGDEANTATYRSAIVSGDGWDYNNITGIGSTIPSTDTGNDVKQGTDKRLFVDVDQASSTINGKTDTIQNFLSSALAKQVTASNGTDIDSATGDVILGGSLTQNTAVDQSAKRILWTGGAFGIEKQFLQVWDTDIHGYPTASTGNWAHVFVDGRGDIGVVKLTTGTLPN